MRGLKGILTLLVIPLVAACTTPYQSSGITGGYDEKQLEAAIWRITYGGNGFTSRETVQTYWLYRCAELTLEKGHDGFELLSNVQLIEMPGITVGPIVLAKGGAPIFIPMYGGASNKPTISGDIRLLKQPFEAAPPKVFDAAALKQALEPVVKGEKCNGNVCPHVKRYIFTKEQLQRMS